MAAMISGTAPDGTPVTHNTPVDANVPGHVQSLTRGGYTNVSVSYDMGSSGAAGGSYGGGATQG